MRPEHSAIFFGTLFAAMAEGHCQSFYATFDTASYDPAIGGVPIPAGVDWERFLTALEDAKKLDVPWKKILSQHSTNKPNKLGGPPNPGGVTPLVQDVPAVGGRGRRLVTIHLPNAFEPNDGLRVEGVCNGSDSNAATDLACREIVAKLLAYAPKKVSLLAKDWKYNVDWAGTLALSMVAPVAPVPMPLVAAQSENQRRRGLTLGTYQEPQPGEDREGLKNELINFMLNFHLGRGIYELDPSNLPAGHAGDFDCRLRQPQ